MVAWDGRYAKHGWRKFAARAGLPPCTRSEGRPPNRPSLLTVNYAYNCNEGVTTMSKKPTEKPAAKAKPAVRPKPFFAAKTLGSFVPALTKKAFEKYGFSAATLITDWPAIIGKDLASQTYPDRLKWPRAPEVNTADAKPEAKGRPGATLFLRVEGPRALEIEYKRAQIAERINAYFGYRAIADVRIVQAPLPKPKPPRGVKRTAADATPLPAVQDEGLRIALERLGAGMKAKKRVQG